MKPAIDARQLRLAATWLLVFGPAATTLVTNSKQAVAFAAVFAVPLVFVAARRSTATLFPVGNALAPFVLLYLAAAAVGLVVALRRGNDPILLAGQLLPAVLVAVGFTAGGSLLERETNSSRAWQFAVITVVLSIPGLVGSVEWLLGANGDLVFRFLAKTALFCPIAGLLVIGFVLRDRPLVGSLLVVTFGFLLVLTLTRSYWLGAVVGSLSLATGYATARLGHGPSRHPRLPRRAWLMVGAVVAVTGSLLTVGFLSTPLRSAFEDRLFGQDSAIDYSLAVRTFEVAAAWHTIEDAPFLGIGPGGKYPSLLQVGDDRVAFGQTNFIHNGQLYFPLKFGALGWATLAALVIGLGILLSIAFRRAWSGGDLTGVTWASALLVIIGASATAPNLVDPVYASAVGVLARFAGGAAPALPRPRRRSSRFYVPLTAMVCAAAGLGVAVGVALAGGTREAPPPNAAKVEADIQALVAAQSRGPGTFVTGLEIGAAGRSTPSGSLLRWWQAAQFEGSAEDLLSFVLPRARPPLSRFRAMLRRVRYVFTDGKPRIVDEDIDAGRATVLAVIGNERLTANRRETGAPHRFTLSQRGNRWYLDDLELIEQHYRAEMDAAND